MLSENFRLGSEKSNSQPHEETVKTPLANSCEELVSECTDAHRTTEDDWSILFEEIVATDIKIDHEKLLKEMDNTQDIICLEKKIDLATTIIDYKFCPNCKTRGKILESFIICEQCGLEREWQNNGDNYNAAIEKEHNTSQNSYMSFNIIGKGAYCYQRSLLKTCSDYSLYRNNNNKKDITNIIFQYEGSKPPTNVVNLAAELFDSIARSGRVYRKNGKKGVMAACLYYACIMQGVARAPKDIAAIMNTEERFLSQGDRILQEFNELKIISIPSCYEPLDDYLNRFFPTLGIDDKYKPFIVDLIHRVEKKHLHIRNECRTTTKCVGAIYMLTRRVKELRHIKKDTISKECNDISKSTFIKYYNLLCSNYKLIKKSFKRHGIPMPAEWK
jgi:transcription initiation factor TFIIIB Brf1 subunit/transcription initiation factor TFIIB